MANTSTGGLPTLMRKRRYVSQSTTSSTYSTSSDVSETNRSDFEGSISSSSVSDVAAIVSNFKVRKQGKEPKIFKPLHQNSLYGKLIEQPFNIMVHVEVWKDTYQISESSAIIELLQLFIDLIGIQEFLIVDFYEACYTKYEDIVEQLKSKLTELHKGTRWVLQLKSAFSKDLWHVVQVFLAEIIKKCNSSEILYAPVFYENIIEFFSETIKSDVRCIRYNALLLGFRLCTELLNIVNEVEQNFYNKLSTTTSSSSSNSGINNKTRCNILAKMIHVFIDATKEHARFDDALMDVAYPICIKQVSIWIYKNSNFVLAKFEPRILLSFLNFHLEHDSIHVRIAVVSAFIMIFENDDFVNFITKRSDLFKYINGVSKKLNDVNIKVRAYAFYFYAVCVSRYPNAITNNLRNHILSHLVAKDKYLYRASGYFCTTYLNKCNSKLDLVKFIIKLSYYENFKNKMGLLVESIIDHFQGFIDYEWLLEMLTNDSVKMNFEESDMERLVEFAYHILHYAVFGKSEFSRKEAPRDHNISYKRDEVTEDIIPIIPKLFCNYSNNVKALQFVLKIILLINFTSDDLTTIHQDIESILETLFECTECCDKPLISIISKFLSKLTDVKCPLQEDCCTSCYVFITVILRRCQNFYLQFTRAYVISECDMKILNQYDVDVAVLASLSNHYDFTSEMDWALVYGNFDILKNESAFNIKITINQIMLCSNYLKWMVKTMGENKQTNNIVKIKISNFYSKLLGMLGSVTSDNFKSLIFTNLVQLSQDITAIIVKHEHLKHLQYKTTAEEDEMVRTFIIRYCFCTDSVSSEQEQIFENFIKFAFLGYVDVADLKYMFKYIFKKNEHYTALFNRIVKMVFDKYGADLISSLILESIFYVAIMGPRIDPHFTSQAKELGCAFMKTLPNNIFPQLLKMGVNYVQPDKKKWVLMQVLTPFTKYLKKIELAKLTKYVQKIFPKPHDKEVLRFLMFIRVKKPLKAESEAHAPPLGKLRLVERRITRF